MGMQYRIKGPQRKKDFKLIADIIEREFLNASRAELRQYAELFRTELQRTIRRQLRRWIRLSPDYAEYKKKHGLDSRILIATGRYVESIFVEMTSVGKKEVVYTVTVPDEPHDPDEPNSINLKLLARVLEYGSVKRNIPPRPHWRPVATKISLLQSVTTGEKLASKALREILKKLRVKRWPFKTIKA